MVAILVDVEVGYGGVMTVEVGQGLQRVRLPQDNVSFLAATCNLLVLD